MGSAHPTVCRFAIDWIESPRCLSPLCWRCPLYACSGVASLGNAHAFRYTYGSIIGYSVRSQSAMKSWLELSAERVAVQRSCLPSGEKTGRTSMALPSVICVRWPAVSLLSG